ncbi:hypothetical protein ACFQFC_32070 [Amorphoplanes digitatis]|uniref:Uncharacterized protein n=1 Tax=Actinoplanes digitatis TaxID=1868 RepID=A0A7W7MNA5_9ACTN|nr:hypothetical protein [Actinoplanes digitatis]MBB4760791.1 hypothetical protein [Actinoplanes digitatis]
MDVWLAGSTVAQLTPPPESIIDGDPAATVVRICCLRREGMSGLEVSVAVDEATAGRFTRACLLETIWKQRVLPAILLVLALTVVGFVIDAVINDSELLGVFLLLAFVLAGVTFGGRFALILLRSRHHPKLLNNSDVLIRDVDPSTARRWADLNPAGAITIRN